MKMSDVFGSHDVWVSDVVATIEHDNVHSPLEDSYVLESASEYVLNSKEEMEAAAHAINNHDTLTERVKELESAIEEVGQYILSIKTNAHNVDVETVSSETREAFAIIAKVLNKE